MVFAYLRKYPEVRKRSYFGVISVITEFGGLLEVVQWHTSFAGKDMRLETSEKLG